MSSQGRHKHRLDRLALRVAGGRSRPQRASTVEGEPVYDGDETMTRAGALKAFGAAAALSLLPLRWMEGTAEAERDCFNPCLGIVKAAADREIGKCRPFAGDFAVGAALPASIWCAFANTVKLQNYRQECYKPKCGDLGQLIERGGHFGSLPIVPLDLPAGTQAECENCTSVGGYCGVCPQGSPGSSFFCGTPPVLPCRYCGGC